MWIIISSIIKWLTSAVDATNRRTLQKSMSEAPLHQEVDDRELEILEHIYENPEHVHQRDLAHIVGLSLGMTNAILKRLAHKGLLKIRKVNNRNIKYIVSPIGAEAIARRSYRYFKRTIKNVVHYRRAIEDLVRRIKADGYDRLILVGVSDLDFIVARGLQSPCGNGRHS